MNKELKEKIESSKATGKKKKGCTTCKKKAPIEKLPELVEIEVYIPTPDEIRLAYIELGNKVDDKREQINKIYNFLFNEDFNFKCKACVNSQARKLKNYIVNNLKMIV